MKRLTDGSHEAEIVAPEKASAGLLTLARLLFLRWHQRQNTERVKVDIFEGAGVNHHVELRLDVPREAWGARGGGRRTDPASMVPELVEKEIGATPEIALQKLVDRLAEQIRLRLVSDTWALREAGKSFTDKPSTQTVIDSCDPGNVTTIEGTYVVFDKEPPKQRGRLPFATRDEGEGEES